MTVTVLHGDCRSILPTLESASAQCCVTSPPYWLQRDYGTAIWTGGDETCDHLQPRSAHALNAGFNERWGNAGGAAKQEVMKQQHYRDVCGKCGAVRSDNQIGMEPTIADYVATMVAVFREVRRVLRPDGVLFLNIGDGYANDGKWGGGLSNAGKNVHSITGGYSRARHVTSLPPKNLIGMPWRVAFALQDDGWILRQEIIWHKPNAMPESVRDRPTRSHEQLFLFATSPKYYYDPDAIREPQTGNAHSRGKGATPKSAEAGNGQVRANASFHAATAQYTDVPGGRNKRSVWSIASQQYPGQHFATFPEKLVEPCILAGSAAGDIVLDPFFGTGTVGRVAIRYGRACVGIELNPDYIAQSEDRTDGVQLEIVP